jgi:hypothetical protein
MFKDAAQRSWRATAANWLAGIVDDRMLAARPEY